MRKLLILALFAACAAAAFPFARGLGRERIPFPHDKHQAAGLECSSCHEGIEQAGDLRGDWLPSPEDCGSCHDAAKLANWGWSEIPDRESDYRTFPHRAHSGADAGCLTCHGALVDPALAAEGKGVSGHSLCFGCHDGMEQTDQCRDCHTEPLVGRLDGEVRNRTIEKPLDHHPSFRHDHKFAVRLDGAGCAECHRQQDFCSECHQGENVAFLVHPRDWLVTHPPLARKNANDCQACHEIEQDCNECHAAQGAVPASHFPLARWRNNANGGLHAEHARRDIGDCASCHEESGAGYVSCTRCHRDTGGRGDQARLNIHPSGFRDDAGEGYWHEDRQASCFDCHTNRTVFCGYCHESR